ncbi:hypothetical protein [Flavihumibacter sp. CACIAM 22H1]|uniref:hypothetical protein n=1 Tax=Flavihumibacter sp. CACIAM 22H1 TaxID=1812911 RepID=UPI0007A80241|nr:hypothetical protein [Flavihumibacter sp. CACIAM 22H1]KYP15357.1 MAG: hypothetical protein A1D16_15780 [Flavihumibacter sp. CACIAM 22H1]
MQEKKKSRPSPLSRNPHTRRDENEIRKIIAEIESGSIGIRTACFKYGLNRNTLKLWMTRLSIRTLSDNKKNPITCSMADEHKKPELNCQIKPLKKSLEYAKLKILVLETMIKVAEEELNIKIRKKNGTKQSKE